MKKLLLFDLDGTLLTTEKTISKSTFEALEQARKKGYLVGVSTSRSEANSRNFLGKLNPDILITSGGAVVKKQEEYIYKVSFDCNRTNEIISIAREICGNDVEITVDTLDCNYWNYKVDPKEIDKSWDGSVWNDFSEFSEEALKICVEIFDDNNARKMEEKLLDCDCVRFSDGHWYKFTRKGITKANSILQVCKALEISNKDIISFGDDYADIGMLKISGIGVAMGNAIDEVKEIADVVIGTNDEDGIEKYLQELVEYYSNYVYMLRCADDSFYIGWTNDLEKRVKAHNEGKGAKYTKARRPVELVYYETFATKNEAMSREYALKQLSRKQKEKLIKEQK